MPNEQGPAPSGELMDGGRHPLLKGCRVRSADSLRKLEAAHFNFAGLHAISDADLSLAALRPHKALVTVKAEEGLAIEPVLLTKSINVGRIRRALDFTGVRWLQLHRHWNEPQLQTLLLELAGLDITMVALADVRDADSAIRLLESVHYVIVDHDAGGTGRVLNRDELESFFRTVPSSQTFIAGGLTPDNVNEVAEAFLPYALDVQSGIIGSTGEQDFRLATAFQQAAFGKAREKKEAAASLNIFQEYSSELWRTIDPRVLNGEQVIAKLNLLATLETISPYRQNTEPVWSRIRRSLEGLESLNPPLDPRWRQAALTIFANTMYIPAPMASETWESLNMDLTELLRPEGDLNKNPWDHLHFFENDPSGMITQFFHASGLEGRLDSEKYARIDSTDRLAETILDLLNPTMENNAVASLKLLTSKPYWVLLVDKTLSGHSLTGDLRRLRQCQRALQGRRGGPPRLVVLAQLASSQALDEVAKENPEPEVMVRAAMVLDQTLSLSSSRCGMIQDRGLLEISRQLCNWFAETLLVPDPRFDRMRDRSGDNLAFGYRGCGLTVVDHTNCPTDSLPLLWYSQQVAGGYQGPYIRVHSRIGGQTHELSASKWEIISSNQTLLNRLSAIGDGAEQ